MPTNAVSGAWSSINILQPTAYGAFTQIPSQEYRQETTRDPKTGAVRETVTIESQDATPFEIVLNVKPTTHSILLPPNSAPILDDYVFDYYLDGIHIAWCPQLKFNPLLPRYFRNLNGDYTNRPLQFAAVDLVDPDDHPDKICRDERVIKSLGTIEINVTRCSLVYQPRIPPIEQRPTTSNQMSFSERSEKASLATTAGLGQESASNLPLPPMDWYVRGRDLNPFLQFIYKYKPRSILEVEGILPSPLPPPPPFLAIKPEPTREDHQPKKSQMDIKKPSKDKKEPKHKKKHSKRNIRKVEQNDDKLGIINMQNKSAVGVKEQEEEKIDDITRKNRTYKMIDLTGSDED
ncbi:hypothetical protein MJO29_001049 [Puccinia striiformis f. sp. tritici]|nr:hypothetical protein Pst134EB_002259 [Puccinia striiformis f. sp. tritici]KAI7967772.1 hypothetical protein MJO29_001049 [Puccinia striiformis f. sp. tritici]